MHRPTVHNVQNTITSYLPRPVGASRRTLIDQQVLKMIVKEYYPFSIVEDKEFVKLLKMLNPGYDLPSRKSLSTSLLSVLYNETYDKVMSDIAANGNFVSITTDGWTSIKNEGYIAVTTHFIDNNCELKSYLLSCFMYSESHTSDNLKNELLRVIKEWGLENKVSACTSDNASNISKAIDLSKWRHVWCFAHSLNLAVQKAIKEIQEVKEKVSGIVRHFKKSSTAAGKLKSIQEQLGYSPPLVLIQDVVTRWNSTFEMFQRVLDLKIPLSTALAETNYNEYLTNNDWIIITRACELLKPFKEITTEISSEKSVSISKIVVLSKSLIKYCNKIKVEYNTCMQISNMIDVLVSEVDTRFRSLELNPLYAESTILDPRFKNYGFLHQYAFSEGKKSLINKAATVNIVNNTQVTSLPNQADDDSIWNDFDSEVVSIVQSSNPTAAFIVELDKYLHEPLLSRREDPLVWWKLNQYVYPRLFKFVKKRFCIMGTSVPCERIFSKAGQTITKKRSRLTSSKFEQMIFLNFNLE